MKARVWKRHQDAWVAELAGGSVTRGFPTWEEAYAMAHQHTGLFRWYWGSRTAGPESVTSS